MNHFKDRLKKIEDVLLRTMPENSSRSWIIDSSGERTEDLSEKTVDTFNAPGLELLNRGGKRWRPLVMVLAGEAAGGSSLIYELTPLVELPHNGSLIVDDIEDKSEERRGGKSVHLLYGDDLSINAGNFMYFLPTYIIDKMELSVEKKYRLYAAYSLAMRRLHCGQGMDIQWHNNHDYIPSEKEYFQMTRFKTGCLSSLAAKIAMIEAGADETLENLAGQIWEDIGIGFQVLDDVMNLSKGNPGKMRGDDIVEGKKSLPMILHCASHRDSIPQVKELFQKSSSDDQETSQRAVEATIAIFEQSGSINKAGEIGLNMLTEAKQQLRDLFPGQDSTELMIDIVDGFIQKML